MSHYFNGEFFDRSISFANSMLFLDCHGNGLGLQPPRRVNLLGKPTKKNISRRNYSLSLFYFLYKLLPKRTNTQTVGKQKSWTCISNNESSLSFFFDKQDSLIFILENIQHLYKKQNFIKGSGDRVQFFFSFDKDRL